MKYYSTALLLSLVLVTTPSICQNPSQTERNNFIDRLEYGESLTVSALGTSLTGGRWRWFDVLQEGLEREYPRQCTFINEGVGASASSHPEGKSGIDKAMHLSISNPDVVFIEFAINDAYKPYDISVEESGNNLIEIINILKSKNPDIEIILQTMNLVIDMPEHGTSESTARSDLQSYLEIYRRIAQELNLLLIDHYPNWEKFYKDHGRDAYIQLVPDGIHPRLEAYRQILLPELKSSLIKTKWLGDGISEQMVIPELDHFLQVLNGKFRLMLCQYEKSQLLHQQAIGNNGLTTKGYDWRISTKTTPIEDDPTGMDVSIELTLQNGSIAQAGFAVAFDFTNWDFENYILLPAAVYNGNRHQIVNRGYAEGIDRKYLYQEDLSLMSVPIPHLSAKNGSISRLEVNSSNLATPAMCFFDKSRKMGFILLAEQKTANSDNGFIVEESTDRTKASFVLAAPGVRAKRPLFVGFAESRDRGVDFMNGDRIILNFNVYSFKCHDIPALLEKFMTIRKSLTGQNDPRNLIPLSQTAYWMTQRIDERWYADDHFQFYFPENANWISFGWIGGLINTYPMIALDDDFHFDRVKKTFDFAIPRAQGESGYFYGALNYDGKPFSRDGYPEIPEIVLTRKNADVLYWMIKQFELLKQQNRSDQINPTWHMNIKRLADAFVSTWVVHGQWGKSLDNQTGAVAEFNTSGGVMAIGGLALASEYYRNPGYLDIAKKSGNYYFDEYFVKKGFTNGGCADILHNADSETAAGLMTSLITLYEVTEDRTWLQKSRSVANLCATWTTSYDYELPEHTELAQLGAKLAGIYWASTQNKHGAPGICTNSGDALFKIYRATGLTRYADLLKDIIHAHGESIRPGGYTNERLTYCDAESQGERGNHVTGWNELNGLLMALEIPGIHIITDSGKRYVFDHLEIDELKEIDGEMILGIHNPTPFDAKTRLLVESVKQSQKPLKINAFTKWPIIEVPTNETVNIKIDASGNCILLK